MRWAGGSECGATLPLAAIWVFLSAGPVVDGWVHRCPWFIERNVQRLSFSVRIQPTSFSVSASEIATLLGGMARPLTLSFQWLA